MKDNTNPISIRLSQEEADTLKEIGGGKSVAAGVKELLRLYSANELTEDSGGIEELKALEAEIKGLKEISMLEKELDKAKEKYKKLKSESLKERILGLINSAG